MGNKVVVIGGSGFLGSHLCDVLSDAGYGVTIIDVAQSAWLRDDQTMVIGDILDSDLLAENIAGAKYVYHLAGIADLSKAAASPKETVSQNLIGSINVLDACVKTDVERLLFASTVYVYSNKGSFYRITKQAIELLIEEYGLQHNLKYTILRYGSLYGPRAQAWNGMNFFVKQAILEGKIVYPGTGDERREYIHVKDAAKLSVQALEPEFINECLTITGSQVLTTREALEMIKEIIHKDPEIIFDKESSEYNQFHYSLTPYRYIPKTGKKIVPNSFIDIGQGILEVIEEIYHQENGNNAED